MRQFRVAREQRIVRLSQFASALGNDLVQMLPAAPQAAGSLQSRRVATSNTGKCGTRNCSMLVTASFSDWHRDESCNGDGDINSLTGDWKLSPVVQDAQKIPLGKDANQLTARLGDQQGWRCAECTSNQGGLNGVVPQRDTLVLVSTSRRTVRIQSGGDATVFIGDAAGQRRAFAGTLKKEISCVEFFRTEDTGLCLCFCRADLSGSSSVWANMEDSRNSPRPRLMLKKILDGWMIFTAKVVELCPISREHGAGNRRESQREVPVRSSFG